MLNYVPTVLCAKSTCLLIFCYQILDNRGDRANTSAEKKLQRTSRIAWRRCCSSLEITLCRGCPPSSGRAATQSLIPSCSFLKNFWSADGPAHRRSLQTSAQGCLFGTYIYRSPWKLLVFIHHSWPWLTAVQVTYRRTSSYWKHIFIVSKYPEHS